MTIGCHTSKPEAGRQPTIQFPVLCCVLAFLATLTLMPSASDAALLIDFSEPHAARAFRVINDSVMGGVSESRLIATSGALAFEGRVSLENNGGFASFRGAVGLPAKVTAILLTVRGDGKRYKLTLKPDDSPATGIYQAVFVAPPEWRTLRFEPADFAASFRGRSIAVPPPRLGEMRYIGLLIAGKQAGPFRVEVRSIGAE